MNIKIYLSITLQGSVNCRLIDIANFSTHWVRVTHICVDKLTTIGTDNGLSPERRQAVIWTNAGILLKRHLGTNFSEILIGNQTFSFKKMRLKMSSAKWRPSRLGLNVLKDEHVLCLFISTFQGLTTSWNLTTEFKLPSVTLLLDVALLIFQWFVMLNILHFQCPINFEFPLTKYWEKY